MKKLVFILFLTLVGTSLIAQELKESKSAFNLGVEAYANGNYTKALEHFQTARKETVGEAINYNLGNAYFKLNKLPESILHYERALKYEPANADALYNLRLANDLIVDRIDNMPQSKATIWWKEFRYGLGADGWAVISIVFAFLSVALLLLYYRPVSRNKRRFGFFGGIACLILMVITIALAESAEEYQKTHNTGVIFTDKVDIKGEPRDGSTNVFVLHAGTKVDILDRNGDWYEVKIASGNQGWMKADDLEEI